MPVTVVIPTFNEAESLRVLLPRLRAVLPEVNVLVVWDGPDDGTLQVCLQNGVWCMKGPGQGLGAAILAGIKNAQNDLVIVMDGDGQHPVSALLGIIRALKSGCPFVAGVRIGQEERSIYRAMMSRFCNLIVRPLVELSDPMTGFFGVDRRTVRWRDINPHTWKIALEIAAKSEDVQEVQYVFCSRIAGQSHAGVKPALQFLRQMALLYLWKIDLQQMLQFGVVGSSGILVNMTVTVTLVELLGVDYRLGVLGGIGTAMQWNYLWNKFWTFRRKRVEKASILAEE